MRLFLRQLYFLKTERVGRATLVPGLSPGNCLSHCGLRRLQRCYFELLAVKGLVGLIIPDAQGLKRWLTRYVSERRLFKDGLKLSSRRTTFAQ